VFLDCAKCDWLSANRHDDFYAAATSVENPDPAIAGHFFCIRNFDRIKQEPDTVFSEFESLSNKK
jgi:hypothetical protein